MVAVIGVSGSTSIGEPIDDLQTYFRQTPRPRLVSNFDRIDNRDRRRFRRYVGGELEPSSGVAGGNP